MVVLLKNVTFNRFLGGFVKCFKCLLGFSEVCFLWH